MAQSLRAALVAGFKSRFHFDNVRLISKEAVCACMSDPRVANLVWCHKDSNLAPQTPIYQHFKATYIDALVEQQMRLAPPARRFAGISAAAAPAVVGNFGGAAGAAAGAAVGVAAGGAPAMAPVAPIPLPISGGLFSSGGRTGALIPSFANFLSVQNSAALPAAAGSAASVRAEKIGRVTDEVERYMKLPVMPFTEEVDGEQVVNDPMSFWKHCQQQNEFKLLLPMVRRAMCIPASEAPSERVFSKLAILIGRLRNRLSPALASDIMFLACNRKMFHKINLTLSPSDL
jgi:hypothetical protein